jgi:RNA polymerase sigma factor (sigma-70 family)
MDDGTSTPVQDSQPSRSVRTATLVSAAKAGDEGAFGQLVTEFSPLLWQVARATGITVSDAEDVLQYVWMRLHEHLAEIRTPGALSGWLVMTTRREAWRVHAVQRRQLPTDQETFADLPDQGLGSEEQVINDEQRRVLWAALHQLSPRCQELLRIIAFVPRPDYAAVAARFGLQVGSVGPTRGRCLAKLRAALGDGLEGNPV